MRLHLFEFEDLKWFPDVIRRGQTDYLHFVISKAEVYKPAASIMKEVLSHNDCDGILDLCSGGGGGADVFQKNLEMTLGRKIKITLSDKYPNIEAFEEINKQTGGSVEYIKDPVDAMNVSDGMKSARTIFSAFHHFSPEDAKAILKDAVKNNVPIGIFEGASRSIKNFLGILITTPVIFFFITPFIKPFRISRIFFTYILPLIPITTLWDGLVSVCRMYTPSELLKMAHETEHEKYMWKSGKTKGGLGNDVVYLTGYKLN